MNELTIIKHENKNYIDSREVAEIIGKEHCHLLRDIRGYAQIMEKNGLSKNGLSDFFIESSFINTQNKKMPCYLISKMGADCIANKLTGEKGVIFTFAYVKKFTEMEARERALDVMPAPCLGEFNSAARLIVSAMSKAGISPQQIVKFLKGVYEPLGIAVITDELENGDELFPQTFTAKKIAEKLGIYSINGNPHYQAVSAILNFHLEIGESHKSIVPNYYGDNIAVSVRYDEYSIEAVELWLFATDYPTEIYSENCVYHVQYQF
jgi:Rha family phage regulatory protein